MHHNAEKKRLCNDWIILDQSINLYNSFGFFASMEFCQGAEVKGLLNMASIQLSFYCLAERNGMAAWHPPYVETMISF